MPPRPSPELEPRQTRPPVKRALESQAIMRTAGEVNGGPKRIVIPARFAMTAKHCLNVAVDADTKDLLARWRSCKAPRRRTHSPRCRRLSAGTEAQLRNANASSRKSQRLEAFAGIRTQPYNLRPDRVSGGGVLS